jgi:hypothetical protein
MRIILNLLLNNKIYHMKKVFIFSALVILVFSSCRQVLGKRIRGNGMVKTETRTIGDFKAIEVNGAIDVYFKQDSMISVKVETDQNLQEYVVVYVENNTVVVEPKDGSNLRPSKSVKVYISGPSVESLEASGASSIVTENKIAVNELTISLSGASDAEVNTKSPKVNVDLSGASTAIITGETKDLKVECSGASKAKCYDLLAENVKADLSGASDAQVFASLKIDAKVSGASDLKYKGNATVSQETSGAASVKKAE